MRVRIALVDDHQPFRERLRALLQRDRHIEIVAEASTGAELLEIAATTAVDVVCMDIRLPGMSGVETTRRLLAARPAVRVIGLSAYADPHYVEAMLDAGAVGLLVPGEKRFVLVVHVPADADRAFGDESLLAGFFATHIVQNTIAASQDCVGDDLLVGRIVFGRSASEKVIVPAG